MMNNWLMALIANTIKDIGREIFRWLPAVGYAIIYLVTLYAGQASFFWNVPRWLYIGVWTPIFLVAIYASRRYNFNRGKEAARRELIT